ncbi:MAG: flagellar biosynthesis protein FlhF [Desulfobacterales bacterium]|nr:flagellar biosynthesis protein FlhF [Desulfobacterales bacterium]
MAARTFKAKTIPEAIQTIKETLGPDAVILSTRRIPKGVRDPYGENFFEVIAEAVATHEPKTEPKTVLPNKTKPRVDNENQDAFVTQLMNQFIPKASPKNEIVSDQGFAKIKEELSTIKEMLYVMNHGDRAYPMISPECLNLHSRLISIGISERRVVSLIQQACEPIESQDNAKPTAEEITKRVLNTLFSSIEIIDPFDTVGDGASEDASSKTHLAAFIGPTGVGKTTTIAKLAAELSLKHRKKIGMISIDNYRIGALEQLKTYSSIMGLPCLPAFSQQDLQIAIQKMRDRDIVLIDTAGHSHLDDKRMKELHQLIDSNQLISTHLVLSTTTSRLNMKEAAENFSLLKPSTYIFTKIDETRQKGTIIDQMLDLKMPISYVTNGQRVPEDILPANKKNLLKLMLNNS